MTFNWKLHPRFRLVTYCLGVLMAVGGGGWLGWRAVHPPVAASSNLNGARLTSSTHDRFQEIYDLVWRSDGNAGNTAVEAIFLFPGFTQRLTEYAERSAIQAELLKTVQAETNTSLIPFSITLERNAPLERNFDWQNVVELKGDETVYPFERFDVSAFPSGRDDVLSGIVWFRHVGTTDADRLTLTLKNVPGNIKTTTFTWDAKVLRLYDTTPVDPQT